MNKNWLVGGLASVLALGGVAFVQGGGGEGAEAEAAAGVVQPIAFPHDLHAGSGAGQANMNCQFCHFSAERSVDAGIPPVSTCWGCHQVIPGTANPAEVAKIQEYFTNGEQIPWVRIYKISDHAHFPHMRHIDAGLECQQCHGEVQEVGPEGLQTRRGLVQGGSFIGGVERSLFGADAGIGDNAPVWGGDAMGWCVDCHRQPDENGAQQASTDCAVCHY
jgi:hypothetical protein